MIYEYSRQKEKDLELLKEDYVFMTELDLQRDTSKGWTVPPSRELFPGNYVEVAPESSVTQVSSEVVLEAG